MEFQDRDRRNFKRSHFFLSEISLTGWRDKVNMIHIIHGIRGRAIYFSFTVFYFNLKLKVYRESVAGSVIQATGTVEFEDGLRTGVLQEDCWCPYSGRATLESDMARPLRQCSPRKPVQYKQSKFLLPCPTLYDVDNNGVRETSRTGLP